jgi:hypothetical protein
MKTFLDYLLILEGPGGPPPPDMGGAPPGDMGGPPGGGMPPPMPGGGGMPPMGGGPPGGGMPPPGGPAPGGSTQGLPLKPKDAWTAIESVLKDIEKENPQKQIKNKTPDHPIASKQLMGVPGF